MTLTPEQTARYQVALAILKDRVATITGEVQTVHRTVVPPGVSWPVDIPNPDNPAKPIRVGTVTRAKSSTVARISDRPAWEAWVRENAPDQILTRHAPRLVTKRTDALEAVLEPFLGLTDGDPWADNTARFVDALALAGFAIVPSRTDDDREEVAIVYEQAILKDAVEGLMVDLPGITVDEVPGATITVRTDAKKNDALALAFFRTFEENELNELAAGTLAIEPPEEEK